MAQFLNRLKHTHVKKQTNKQTNTLDKLPCFHYHSCHQCLCLALCLPFLLLYFSLWLLLNTCITTFFRNNQISRWGVIATGISTSSWRLIIRLWWAVKQSWLCRIPCFIFINFLLLLLFLLVNLDELIFQKRVLSVLKGRTFTLWLLEPYTIN